MRLRIPSYGVALNLVAGLLAGCQSGPRTMVWEHQQTLVAEIDVTPDNSASWSGVESENGCHAIVRSVYFREGGKERVQVDGQQWPEFDGFIRGGIQSPTIIPSPDGQHMAACVVIDGKQHVIVDGIVGPAVEGLNPFGFHFSKTGGRYFYFSHSREKIRILLNGLPEPEFDEIFGFDASDDGQQIVYVGGNKDGSFMSGYRSQVFINGKPGPKTNAPHPGVAVSGDGKHLAFVTDAGDKVRVVLDGVPGPDFDIVGEMAFSSNGRHFAYAGNRAGNGMLVIDGMIQSQLNGEAFRAAHGGQVNFAGFDFQFCPDGRHIIYQSFSAMFNDLGIVDLETMSKRQIKSDEGKTLEARFGSGGNIFGSGDWDAFSPDGTRFAYWILTKDDRAVVMIDDKPRPAVDEVFDLYFSADSKHVAYLASNGSGYKTRDRVEIDGIPGPEFDMVSNFSFSLDGGHFAYWAYENGKHKFILDGKELPGVDGGENFVFSADGKRIAIIVGGSRNPSSGDFDQAWVAIDGVSGPKFDKIVAGPVVRKDGNLEYMATQKASNNRVRLFRVVVPGYSPPSSHGVVPKINSTTRIIA